MSDSSKELPVNSVQTETLKVIPEVPDTIVVVIPVLIIVIVIVIVIVIIVITTIVRITIIISNDAATLRRGARPPRS